MRPLITGATGFVGRALVARLGADGVACKVAVRRRALFPSDVTQAETGEIGPATRWADALSGVDVVVHLAARVHVMQETASDPLADFRRVNVQGTLQLARAAASSGARRFVYLSSVKVNGEHTSVGQPFRADDEPRPADAYAVSKMEAEAGLRMLARETGLEVVIIRPPLVYGPGVKANFATMMRWLARGVPLPLGSLRNQRSLVALDNLVDLIVVCMGHPAAANRTFMASDGDDLSTTELLQRLGAALGRPARLLPVPPAVLKAGAALAGRSDMARRLCDSLQVDIQNTRTVLGWTPPASVDEGLRRVALGHLDPTA